MAIRLAIKKLMHTWTFKEYPMECRGFQIGDPLEGAGMFQSLFFADFVSEVLDLCRLLGLGLLPPV